MRIKIWGLTPQLIFVRVIVSFELMNLNKKNLQKSGQVLEALPNALFKVRLDDGREVLAYLAGRLKIYRIKVLPGDRVTVEMSPYDDRRGRIVYRGK